jgi:phenylalanyl-tRNA synthetase beta chain
MTILTLNRKELEEKTGKLTPEIEEKITMMGSPVEKSNEEEIQIEVFPNRPDLLSLQGFSRSFLQYLGKSKPQTYKIKKPEKDYRVIIDKSVKEVRPFTQCAIIKGLKLNDKKIKEIIDIQEKLHMTIGRKRKKIAIGIYPLEKISLPIKYLAKKPEEIKFIPLESPGLKEMNARQILRNLPTGREYAHLLENLETFPVFIDNNNEVLSLPPIINSYKTGKITQETKEVFIECSGFNKEYLKKTLNIIVCALADMGGDIYSMEIQEGWSKEISPDLNPEELEFRIQDINKTLGLELTEKEVTKYLAKMGIDCKTSKSILIALIPQYRTDILHWIDLAEEVALAYGYDNFIPELPKISTIGLESNQAKIKKTITEILSGLGLLECSSFHLSTKKDIKKMNYTMKNEEFIELEDSKTEYEVLRNDLMSNLLKIFSENSDSQYPQKIFEIGKVFSLDKEKETGINEKENLCIGITQENANFTEIKQVLDYLFKMIQKTYEIKQGEHIGMIPGRCGEILIDNKSIGHIGEIHPRVLKNWKLKMPLAILEINLDWLLNNQEETGSSNHSQ